MEKVTTVVDEKAIKECYKSSRILCYVLAGLGGFGVGFYFMYSIMTQKWIEPFNGILFIMGIVFIIVGVILDGSISKAIKAVKANPATTITEFKEDHLFMEAYRNGEKVSEGKEEYKMFKHYIVKTHYVFMYTKTNVVYTFTKSDELVEFLSKTGIKKFQ